MFTHDLSYIASVSVTHIKICEAAKIHLYKYQGEIQGGGAPRMPLHHPPYFRYPFFNTGVKLLSGANCLVPP